MVCWSLAHAVAPDTGRRAYAHSLNPSQPPAPPAVTAGEASNRATCRAWFADHLFPVTSSVSCSCSLLQFGGGGGASTTYVWSPATGWQEVESGSSGSGLGWLSFLATLVLTVLLFGGVMLVSLGNLVRRWFDDSLSLVPGHLFGSTVS